MLASRIPGISHATSPTALAVHPWRGARKSELAAPAGRSRLAVSGPLALCHLLAVGLFQVFKRDRSQDFPLFVELLNEDAVFGVDAEIHSAPAGPPHSLCTSSPPPWALWPAGRTLDSVALPST